MTCQVVDAKPAQGIAFICGEAEEPAACHFCGQPAAYLCDWKTEKRVDVRAENLHLGDRRCSPGGSVVYCSTTGGESFIAFELGDRVQQVRVPWHATFTILRPGTCDQPCCYFCAREVDDDVHHCQDHWREAGIAA